MSHSPIVRRRLAAFPTSAAAEEFVARIASSEGQDLEQIAMTVMAQAEKAPHPNVVLRSVAEALVDLRPFADEDAIAGLAELAAADCQIGLGCAALAGSAFSRLLYGVSPFDPVTFIAVPVVLMLAAVLACVAPARRAASIDPIRALRS